MIPTSHFRWWHGTVHMPAVLQQLWVPLNGDETLFMPLPWLEKHGGEWREIPREFVGAKTTAPNEK